MKPGPSLRAVPFTGENRCSWLMGACRETASWHILWKVENKLNVCSLLCSGHVDAATENYTYVDIHRVMSDCDMPSSKWAGKICTV